MLTTMLHTARITGIKTIESDQCRGWIASPKCCHHLFNSGLAQPHRIPRQLFTRPVLGIASLSIVFLRLRFLPANLLALLYNP
jgi:hypothetical protein